MISVKKLVIQSLTTTIPFGHETGVEELHTSAIYASSFAGENSLFKLRPLSILRFNSGKMFSFTNTIVLFFIPPVVPSKRLNLIPFTTKPFL